MNIYFRACVLSVHHQRVHMISDGHAIGRSIVALIMSEVYVKPSLHQAFSQIVDVVNRFIHALLYNTRNK